MMRSIFSLFFFFSTCYDICLCDGTGVLEFCLIDRETKKTRNGEVDLFDDLHDQGTIG